MIGGLSSLRTEVYTRPWLYEAIQQLGWHPFMRINSQGAYQADPWLIITDLTPQQAQRKLVWDAPLD